MDILHIVPHGGSSGISRELDLLLAERPAHVCCLGADGLAAHKWRTGGIQVDVLNWRRWLDPRPLWALASRIRLLQPRLIHVWGLAAPARVRLAAPQTRSAIVVRQPLAARKTLAPLDRWLLRGADLVLASSMTEARICAEAGTPVAKVKVVTSGVRAAAAATSDERPCIVCAGGLLPHKGFFEAIWAFDILCFAQDDVELTIAGEGPERRRLADFVARTGLRGRIHLVGEVADMDPLLAQAAVVWVPSLADSGFGVALQAMAAGRPVVASRWPALAELVVDGETGYLVQPGSKIELAQKTRRLLGDAGLRRRLGAAGRRRAEEIFSPGGFTASWQRACNEVAA